MRVTFWKEGIEPLNKQGGKLDDGKQRFPNSNPIPAPKQCGFGKECHFSEPDSLSVKLMVLSKSTPSFALQDSGRPYKACQLHEKIIVQEVPPPPSGSSSRQPAPL